MNFDQDDDELNAAIAASIEQDIWYIPSHENRMEEWRALVLNADDAELETILTEVMTLYDENGDGEMDFSEFTLLVGDLLCLTHHTSEVPPATARSVAEALAQHGVPHGENPAVW